GYTVPPYYDSLLAKIIVWGNDREEACARMERALTETVISGVPRSAPFLRRVVASAPFRRAQLHTGFLAEHAEELLPTRESSSEGATV
ncbi:MAG: hypothetical protein ACR2J8_06525, partial [Thermomicrobiales bacterium]